MLIYLAGAIIPAPHHNMCFTVHAHNCAVLHKSKCALRAAEVTVAFLLAWLCRDACQQRRGSLGEIRNDEAAKI